MITSLIWRFYKRLKHFNKIFRSLKFVYEWNIDKKYYIDLSEYDFNHISYLLF